MIERKKHKYTSGFIVSEDGKGSSVGEFNPPDTEGAEWTLVEVQYLILPTQAIRWVARWQRTVIILDTPKEVSDPKP